MVGMVWASIISYIRGHTKVKIEQHPTPLDTLSFEEIKSLPRCSHPKEKVEIDNTPRQIEIRALPPNNDLLTGVTGVIPETVTVNASLTKHD